MVEPRRKEVEGDGKNKGLCSLAVAGPRQVLLNTPCFWLWWQFLCLVVGEDEGVLLKMCDRMILELIYYVNVF